MELREHRLNLENLVEKRTRDLVLEIKERRKVEAELRLTQEKLEDLVKERTMHLEEAQARMILQEKMASIGQLAAGLAHELNNPIHFIRVNFAALSENFQDISTVLKGYQHAFSAINDSIELVTRLYEAARQEKELSLDMILDDLPSFFEECDRGFKRVAAIISSMLEFAHVDSRNSLKDYDINQGIRNTLVIAENASKNTADVRLELAGIPEVRCYPDQVNQVFLNLLINSIQAIASAETAEKGQITIRTWGEETSVCCSITDNGPGIPAEIQSRIFDPFYTTKPPGTGTGMGLSISYDIIVRKHGGELAVDCPEEGGTVFTLRLPVK